MTSSENYPSSLRLMGKSEASSVVWHQTNQKMFYQKKNTRKRSNTTFSTLAFPGFLMAPSIAPCCAMQLHPHRSPDLQRPGHHCPACFPKGLFHLPTCHALLSFNLVARHIKLLLRQGFRRLRLNSLYDFMDKTQSCVSARKLNTPRVVLWCSPPPTHHRPHPNHYPLLASKVGSEYTFQIVCWEW